MVRAWEPDPPAGAEGAFRGRVLRGALEEKVRTGVARPLHTGRLGYCNIFQ
jgi:hypothetical protein